MRLLTSQKDTLYDLIEKRGLSPTQFEFSDNRSAYGSGISTWLHFNNSEYAFRFDSFDNSPMPSFCPGQNSFNENGHARLWNDVLAHFTSWLINLKREINAPNKWERLEKEIAGIKINFSNDQDKFSAHEYEELKAKTETLKQSVSEIGLLPEQAKAIHAKLDHLITLAKDMNKFDWKSLFIGTIISIVIQLSVTQENAKSLWTLIKQVFSNYFLP